MDSRTLWRQAHAAYKAAKARGGNEFAVHVRRGRNATLAHQIGGATFRHRRLALADAPPAHAAAADPLVAPLLPRGDGLGGEGDVDEADAAWAIAVADSSGSVGTLLQRIDAIHRSESRANSAAKEAEFKKIQQWRVSDWTSASQHVFNADEVPLWSDQSGVVPQCRLPADCCLQAYRWQCPGRAVAKHILAQADQGLKEDLLADWLRRHQRYTHAAAPPLHEPASKQDSICIMARMCLCHRLTLRLFVAALLKSFRQRAPPHSALRQAVAQGTVVLCIERDVEPLLRRWIFVGYINLTSFHAAVPLSVTPRQ